MAGRVLVAGWSGNRYAITTWPVTGPLSGASESGLHCVVIRPLSILPSTPGRHEYTELNTHIMTSALSVILLGLALLYVVWVFTHGDRW